MANDVPHVMARIRWARILCVVLIVSWGLREWLRLAAPEITKEVSEITTEDFAFAGVPKHAPATEVALPGDDLESGERAISGALEYISSAVPAGARAEVLFPVAPRMRDPWTTSTAAQVQAVCERVLEGRNDQLLTKGVLGAPGGHYSVYAFVCPLSDRTSWSQGASYALMLELRDNQLPGVCLAIATTPLVKFTYVSDTSHGSNGRVELSYVPTAIHGEVLSFPPARESGVWGFVFSGFASLWVHVESSGRVVRRAFVWDMDEPYRPIVLVNWKDDLRQLVRMCEQNYRLRKVAGVNVVVTGDGAQGDLLREVIGVLYKSQAEAETPVRVFTVGRDG